MPNVGKELCEMGLIEFKFLISFCTNQMGYLGKLNDTFKKKNIYIYIYIVNMDGMIRILNKTRTGT